MPAATWCGLCAITDPSAHQPARRRSVVATSRCWAVVRWWRCQTSTHRGVATRAFEVCVRHATGAATAVIFSNTCCGANHRATLYRPGAVVGRQPHSYLWSAGGRLPARRIGTCDEHECGRTHASPTPCTGHPGEVRYSASHAITGTVPANRSRHANGCLQRQAGAKSGGWCDGAGSR